MKLSYALLVIVLRLVHVTQCAEVSVLCLLQLAQLAHLLLGLADGFAKGVNLLFGFEWDDACHGVILT